MHKKATVRNNYNKKLSVTIEIPENKLKDFIVISHCFTCSKLYKLYANISKILLKNGYGVVKYDAMGLGESEGDFSETSFSTNVEDLITVYNYISNNYQKPSYLFGHSLGSLVSIKGATMLDSVRGVATVGSPANLNNLIDLFASYEDQLVKKDKVEVNLSGKELNIGYKYLEDLRSQNIPDILKAFNKSIIIFHSNTDNMVPYKIGLKLFNSINSEKSFITLSNVHHLANEKKDSRYIGEILNTWLDNV